jgi:ribose transport system permease protein
MHWGLRGESRAVRGGRHLLIEYGVLSFLLICMYVGFGIAEPRFAAVSNLINILQQSSFLAIFAVAQTFVLLTRGFDLSVGQLTSTVSVVSAMAMAWSLKHNPGSAAWPILVGCATGIAMGALVGVVNGASVSLLGITPFVATLAMQGICFGFATTLSGGFPVADIPVEFTGTFSQGKFLSLPVPVFVGLIIIILAEVCMKFTVLGRALYFIGGNPRAAHVAGLPARAYLIAAYSICSILVAIGSLLLTARTGSGEPTLGGGLMLQSIAAAVIGGVSLRGGEGGIIHAALGSLFVTILSIGMDLTAINANAQQVFVGVIVVLAVYVDRLRTRAFLRAD